MIIALLMFLFSKRKEDFLLFVIGGLFGAFAEGFAMSYGAWVYANSDFFGIPLWLPLLWGIAAIYMNKIQKGIIEFLESKK